MSDFVRFHEKSGHFQQTITFEVINQFPICFQHHVLYVKRCALKAVLKCLENRNISYFDQKYCTF